MIDLLFVYGTLMRGHGNPMSRLLSAQADFVGDATCRGRLHRIKHYPGLLLSDDPGDIAHGEMFRLRDPAALLRELDVYESCSEAFAAPTEYIRQIVEVTTDDGVAHEVWTYVYNWPVTPQSRIVSGKFSSSPG